MSVGTLSPVPRVVVGVGGGRSVWVGFILKKILILRQNYIILLVCNGDIALPLSGFTAPAYSAGANFFEERPC